MLDRRLEYVVAVARAGSFTAAAGLVGVTQSAITKSIGDLEQQIGFAIFVRTARGALLTERGRDFAERAHMLVEDTKELLNKPTGEQDAYSGILRIGVCPASMEFWILEPLAKLLRKHPSIRVDVSGSNFERVVQQLRNGSIDVAVGFDAAFGEWPDLRRRTIPFDNASYLFVRKGHPLLSRPNIEIRDLADFNFVSPSDSRPYGVVIRSIYEDHGADWQKRVHTVDFFPLVRKIVASSDAIGVVLTTFADQSESFRNQFEILKTPRPFLRPSALCCAIRARWEPNPAVKSFMSIMQSTSAQVAV